MTNVLTWTFAQLLGLYNFVNQHYILSFFFVCAIMGLIVSIFVNIQGKNK